MTMVKGVRCGLASSFSSHASCATRSSSVSVKLRFGVPSGLGLISCGMLLSSAMKWMSGFFAGKSKLYHLAGMVQRVWPRRA